MNEGTSGRGTPRLDWRSAAVALAVAIVVICTSLPAALRLLDSLDFNDHIGFTADLDRTHVLRTPHFLFSLFTILAKWLLQTESYMAAGIVVVLLANAATGVIAFRALRSEKVGRGLAFLGASGLLLFSQAFLLMPYDNEYYWGYLAPNVTHSATYFLLKPLALLSFLAAERLFAPNPPRPLTAAQVAIFVALATLAKPSYTIVLLPALAAVALWRHTHARQVPWRYLTLGIVLPAIAVLGWQWLVTYGPAAARFGGVYGDKSSLIFSPLVAMRHRSSLLFPKFLLSVLFPATVLALVRPARRDGPIGLAVTGFAIGSAYAYLLAESGERLFHGNFSWSAYIALFLLVFAALRVLCRAINSTPSGRVWRNPRLVACAAVFALHLACGAYVEYLCLREIVKWDWKAMIVGVDREVRVGEHCVALTPAGKQVFTNNGHRLLVQAVCGRGRRPARRNLPGGPRS